jgi:hypothetical protein
VSVTGTLLGGRSAQRIDLSHSPVMRNKKSAGLKGALCKLEISIAAKSYANIKRSPSAV